MTSNWDTVPIVNGLDQNQSITRISEVQSAHLLSQLQLLIKCRSPSRMWWWAHCDRTPFVFQYDGNYEFYWKVWRLFGADDNKDLDREVFLVITDDYPPPWPTYSGRLMEFLRTINSYAAAEYVVLDMDARWVIFDTHHNCLLAFGHI